MSDNKEILEMAARAAGYEVTGYEEGTEGVEWQGTRVGVKKEGLHLKDRAGVWNPLRHKADAFDLIVDLGLEISVKRQLSPIEKAVVVVWDCRSRRNLATLDTESNDSLGTVTLRAITLAAVEVGKLLS